MQGHLALILHAHLPFVRHPEHEKFLEENWLFEALTETYLPLLRVMEDWQNDDMQARLTLSLSPPLCAMLRDPMLQERYVRHLGGLIQLAENEIHRTHWEPALRELAWMYHNRFITLRETYFDCNRDLVGAFRRLQDDGMLEIATCAATHALLPLLAGDPSLRAQILTARDHYTECFGRGPRGLWLPECAYAAGIEDALQEADIRWFVTDTHGLLHAQPRPRYGVFAPVFLPNGIAAFGRDFDSARQVWSKHQGYPGDFRYRDFYRDIGYDLDLDYVKPYLPAPGLRGFTGIKYHRITAAAPETDKEVYSRAAALAAADEHAGHFLGARTEQFAQLGAILDRPPIVVSPYDAELFGHWWYEGPEFLDLFVRKAYYDQQAFTFITPAEYLRHYPTQQVATPGASSWGEEGYWRVWLNESNEWIYPHLKQAQLRMTEIASRFSEAGGVTARAARQAGRELLLAQSSDWPFILRTGTSPGYAARRVKEHLLRFHELYEQLMSGQINEPRLSQIEQSDNIFPNLDFRYWKR
ncbi:MAG TPA: 1,4-alpha-glucan branching protein domain-containing protein [Verrucomicrobiae bacterium]|jgi:1,4-alpha-glucan branching enzyme